MAYAMLALHILSYVDTGVLGWAELGGFHLKMEMDSIFHKVVCFKLKRAGGQIMCKTQ
jgi:hypothetical protein